MSEQFFESWIRFVTLKICWIFLETCKKNFSRIPIILFELHLFQENDKVLRFLLEISHPLKFTPTGDPVEGPTFNPNKYFAKKIIYLLYSEAANPHTTVNILGEKCCFI